MNRSTLAILLAFALASVGFAADPGVYPRDDKNAAREWFWKWWPKGHEQTTGFTGSYENGIPGKASDAWLNAMETRVNLFRRVAGLKPVTTDAEYNRLCQAGAILIMSDWSHAPAKTAKNWTEDGFKAAQGSSLGTGSTWRNPVMDLIYDGGVVALGHRATFLIPGLSKVGFGTAYGAEGLKQPDLGYVFLMYANDPSGGQADPSYTDPFIMWPAKGWIPTRLIPANWSIRVADYGSNPSGTSFWDLRSATVEISRNGVKMPVGGGPDSFGFQLIVAADGSAVNGNKYVEGGSGKVVNGVQTPKTVSPTFDTLIFCHDSMHGEVSAWGQNAMTEDPFGDVIYDVKISGIKVRATGVLWNGTGVYQYQVKGFDLQTPNTVSNQAKLINISTRSPVRTGSGVQIAGFVVGGTKPHKVLVRGSGPALVPFGVTGTLANPKLSVFKMEADKSVLVASNDDWSSDAAQASAIETVSAAVGAFPWTRGSKDAALVLTLAPGNYTGVVEGADGGTGNGLVEVYDADTSDTGAKVVNISSRTYVGDQGSDYQIAGFVLKGDMPRTVLVRVSGRDLAQFGVADTLEIPSFELYAGQIKIGEDSFKFAGRFAFKGRYEQASKTVGAFPLDPEKDGAVGLFTLLPDVPYSVVIKGSATRSDGTGPVNTKGNALVEIYEFP